MEGSEGEEVVEGEFLGTELHLAEVDDAVGAPDHQVDLRAFHVWIARDAPPGGFVRLHAGDAERRLDLLVVV